MKKETYHCDRCGQVNEDRQEYNNEIILVGNGGTKRNWRVCPHCLETVTQMLLDSAKYNER